MGQLGDLLREAREAKGLSLEQVEKTTNIRKKLLQALEQEAYQELPAPVFVKGFVRNYARLLDLDPEQAIVLYKEAAGDAERPYELKALSEPLEESPSRLPWILAAFLVILVGLLGWWGYARGFIKLPDLPSLSLRAATATQPPAATLSPATTVAEIATPTRSFSSTPASPVTDIPTVQVAATDTAAPSATAAETATPVPSHTATVSPTATLTAAPTFTPSPTATWPASDAPIQVALIADMSVWLRVYTDGAKVFEGMMDQGVTRAWSANQQIYVHCGYANGVRAVVNGQEYGQLGPQADTVRIEWALAAGTPSVSSVVKPTQIVLPTATRAP